MKVGINRLKLIIFGFLGFSFSVQAEGANWVSELSENVYLHRSQAGVLDDSGWTHVTATQGHFEVKVPFKFEEWSVLVSEYNMFVHNVGGTTKEGIKLLVTEFPNFDGIANFSSKNLSQRLLENTSLVRKKHFKFRGMDATQVWIKGEEYNVVRRYIVDNDKLFCFSVESPKSHKRLAKKVRATFFNSFRVKKTVN